MDEIVLHCVAEGTTTVLNLAAGLDTRPYRLNLPPNLRWLHVDMPHMIDYYRTRMAAEQPRCDLQFIGADLRDAQTRRDVFARATSQESVLVITEGLLIYLEATQVTDLARDLHNIAGAHHWLTDLAMPRLRQYLERQHAPKLREGNAPMQFFPDQGTAFFEPLGWREVEFRSSWLESRRLKRSMRFAWLLRLLSRLQSRQQREETWRMSGIVLLEAK